MTNPNTNLGELKNYLEALTDFLKKKDCKYLSFTIHGAGQFISKGKEIKTLEKVLQVEITELPLALTVSLTLIK